MDFQGLIENITKKDLSETIIKDFETGNRLDLTGSEKGEIQRRIEEYALKTKFIPTLNYLVIGLLYDVTQTFDKIKRKGLFRYSTHLNNKNIIEPLFKRILELSDKLSLNRHEVLYLKSIINLSPLHKILKNCHRYLINEIVQFNKRPLVYGTKPSLVKTLISYLDYLFLIGYYPSKQEDPNALEFYGKEAISEAVSYIIFLKKEMYGLNESDGFMIDEDYVSNGRINELLLKACQFKKLQEFEILIEHFSYTCENKNNKVIIRPPAPDMEKSIRLGYIKTELQRNYDMQKLDQSYRRTTSLKMVSKKIEALSHIELLKFTESYNIPHYILQVPEPILGILADTLLKQDLLFAEEIEYLSHIFKEQLLNLEKVKSFYIKDNFSLFDFIKIKRFFVILHSLFSKNLQEKLQDNREILLRSLIPTFTKEKLYQLLCKLFSRESVDDFLDVVVWDPDEKSIFDLQYQPFLKLNDLFMLPVSIFVYSNTIRNIFASQYKSGNPKIFDDGRYDPIADKLEQVFKDKSFKTFKQISHSYKNGGDIDFLAHTDNFLFIAECKNSLLPASIYELRTVYDNINKANKQLNLILEGINSSQIIKELSRKIRFDLSKIKKIKTAIVTSNRLFTGSQNWQHPVRNINELLNVVQTGNVRTRDGLFSIWEGKEFSVNDLINYLDDSNILNRVFYDSMVKKELSFKDKTFELVFETYALYGPLVEDNFKSLSLRKV